MSCLIEGIPGKECNTINTPGTIEVHAIPSEDLEEIVVVDHQVATFTKKTGKAFVKITITKTSGDLKATFDGETEDAEYWQHELLGHISSLSAVKHKALDTLAGVPLIIVAKASTGKKWIGGDKDFPMKLRKVEGGTGTPEAGQKSGYDITFRTSLMNHALWEYTGELSDLEQAGT